MCPIVFSLLGGCVCFFVYLHGIGVQEVYRSGGQVCFMTMTDSMRNEDIVLVDTLASLGGGVCLNMNS